MNKKIYLSTIAFLIIAVTSVYALMQEKNRITPTVIVDNNDIRSNAIENSEIQSDKPSFDNSSFYSPEELENSRVIFYYGEGCFYCEDVEEYIEDYEIQNKVAFLTKEVGNNQENLEELREKAKTCNMPGSSIDLPFLWDGNDGNKCLMGYSQVAEYFKIKANIQ